MTYEYQHDETGAFFRFPSFDAYEAALNWYNSNSKSALISFCQSNGIVIDDPESSPAGRHMVADWRDRACQAWAGLQPTFD
jgi:hypothetical protein